MKFYETTYCFLTCVLIFGVQTHIVHDWLECESYMESSCNEIFEKNCFKREKCPAPHPERRDHCFTVWEYNKATNKAKVQMKGCFSNNKNCYKTSHCVRKNKDDYYHIYFCCCNGNMCNENFTFTDYDTDYDLASNFSKTKIKEENIDNAMYTAIVIIMCTVCIMIFICAFCWYFSHVRAKDDDSPPEEPNQDCKSSCSEFEDDLTFGTQQESRMLVASLELKFILGSGRYGVVYKAMSRDPSAKSKYYAVKVVNPENSKSWENEVRFFKKIYMRHPNIVEALGFKHTDNNIADEYWLVTEYCDGGSLQDYLTAHMILHWDRFINMAIDITKGLAMLHHWKFPNNRTKRPVAHRDIKSKNILVRSNFTLCIADFGLAVTSKDISELKNSFKKSGTTRYMSPELLSGAINFTTRGFLAIDIYACSLVYWELLSRCSVLGRVESYQLPYERELGGCFTEADLQEFVVENKKRPTVPKKWKRKNIFKTFCEIMEECWDQDPEARLNMHSALYRLVLLRSCEAVSNAELSNADYLHSDSSSITNDEKCPYEKKDQSYPLSNLIYNDEEILPAYTFLDRDRPPTR